MHIQIARSAPIAATAFHFKVKDALVAQRGKGAPIFILPGRGQIYAQALGKLLRMFARKRQHTFASQFYNDFLLGGKSFGIFSTLCTQGATMKGSGALMGYSAGAYVNGTGVLISSQCYSLGAWGAILSGIARKLKKCSNIIDIRSSGDLFLRRFDSPLLKKLSGLAGRGWRCR